MTGNGNYPGPLDGLRVIDLTTWLGAYSGRLLSDLGAEVIRVEPAGGVPERHWPPVTQDGLSFAFAFTEAGKRSVLAAETDLEALLSGAQVLLTSEGPDALRARGLHPEDVVRRHPALVHVSISPYGLTGPYADRPASDLTMLAAGGLLSLGGDPDREPVRPWPNQTAVIAGTHATVATLIAVLSLESTGQGQFVDLSVQEAVAQSMENAVQYLDLEGVLRKRAGAGPVEAGTGTFQCADGLVYLVGGVGGRPLAWDGIIEWLLENGMAEAETLRGDEWQDPAFRRSVEACATFRDIFERFAAPRTKSDLYEAGQRYGISIAPVSTPQDVLASPQLAYRDYFQPLPAGAGELLFPGPPYRFTNAQVGPRSGPPELAGHAAPHEGTVA